HLSRVPPSHLVRPGCGGKLPSGGAGFDLQEREGGVAAAAHPHRSAPPLCYTMQPPPPRPPPAQLVVVESKVFVAGWSCSGGKDAGRIRRLQAEAAGVGGFGGC
uniref:Uncharacterized protein n=4 Tax=Aegilops tauschii subsp. strangulata TaxID=200361 RepID=A0A453PI92_AEGTS